MGPGPGPSLLPADPQHPDCGLDSNPGDETATGTRQQVLLTLLCSVTFVKKEMLNFQTRWVKIKMSFFPHPSPTRALTWEVLRERGEQALNGPWEAAGACVQQMVGEGREWSLRALPTSSPHITGAHHDQALCFLIFNPPKSQVKWAALSSHSK